MKEDLHYTPAEMVYGTTLRLPGQFFVPQPASETLQDPISYVDRLRQHTHYRLSATLLWLIHNTACTPRSSHLHGRIHPT